jgi:hypothetical protein
MIKHRERLSYVGWCYLYSVERRRITQHIRHMYISLLILYLNLSVVEGMHFNCI